MSTVAVGMIRLQQRFPDIRLRLMSVDMAEIARVRNFFASVIMHEKQDAVIMVDADMAFSVECFVRLLESGHEVCGLTYPKRTIDLRKFHQLAASGRPYDASYLLSLDFILAGNVVSTDGRLDVKEGFVETSAVPGGCLLIRATALQRLWRELPEIRQTDRIADLEAKHGLRRVYRCFDNMSSEGTTWSEDISFCMRWRSIGGRVFALADASVEHFGSMKFEGSYFEWLKLQAEAFLPAGQSTSEPLKRLVRRGNRELGETAATAPQSGRVPGGRG